MRSFLCIQYTQLPWWISQLARFRPRNRVWSGMKHLEEEPERDAERRPSIKPVKKWFPEITFSLSLTFAIWSGRFRFIFQHEKRQPIESHGPGSGSVVQYFPHDWWCVFLSRVTSYCFPEKQLRMQMTSYRAPLVLTLPRSLPALTVDVPWRFFFLSLSHCFLCQAFDVIGKASAGKEWKC